MNLSWTVRIALIVSGLLIALIGLFMWAEEAEHSGWTAMEGLEEGYLPTGLVEIREVPWSETEAEMSGTYEVRLVSGDEYEVAYIDREGTVLFTGTSTEVTAWLDDQGEQAFIGTRTQVEAWTDEQRATEKSFMVPAITIGFGIVLFIAAVIPNRGATGKKTDLTGPPAPAI